MRSTTPLADVAVGASLLALAGLLWRAARDIPPPFFDPLGSAAVPRAAAVIIAALSIAMLLPALAALRAGRPVASDPGYRHRPWLAAALVGLCLLYAGLMEVGLAGFREATVGFVFAAGALLGGFRLRRLLAVAVLALLLGVGGYYLFTNVFYIDLPA